MSRTFFTPIVLPADPAYPMEAATKQYADAKVATVMVGEYGPVPALTPGTWVPLGALLDPVVGCIAQFTTNSGAEEVILDISQNQGPEGGLLVKSDVAWSSGALRYQVCRRI